MNVVMLLDNPFVNDLRVYREAKSIVAMGHRLVLVGLRKKGLPFSETVDGIEIKRLLDDQIFDIKQPKMLKHSAKCILAELKQMQIEADVLHCHDQTMLEIGGWIKREKNNIPLIYDSHEMFHAWPLNLSANGSVLLWIKSHIVRKLQIRREKKNARHIDYLITVSSSIADRLASYFHLNRKPITLRNVPYFKDLAPSRYNLRKTLNIPSHQKIIVFIAGNLYLKSQNIGQLIEEFADNDLALVFIAGESPGKTHYQHLVEERQIKNIYFHDRLPPHEIIDCIAQCDVGVLPYWNKKDLSYWYSLPNKLFDYIMAELPILSSAQPEYKNIIETHALGVCVQPDTPHAFLNGFHELMTNHAFYQSNLTRVKANFTWEKESEKLINLYQEIAEKKEKT
jgi:glycosyltransferase involved in cell wall biosynthesis